MNENHAVSLSIAKQLKEAGWEKETEFWWRNYYEIEHAGKLMSDFGVTNEFTEPLDDHDKEGGLEKYPAPLATEILEELPKNITIENTRGDYWKLIYQSPLQVREGMVHYDTEVFEDTFCNALAKMWLYLRKEKII